MLLKALAPCLAIVTIGGCYAVYVMAFPDPADGALFGTLMMIVGALGGISGRQMINAVHEYTKKDKTEETKDH